MEFPRADDPVWKKTARRRSLSKEELNAFHAEVHEALFRRLDSAFPDFGWTRDRDGRGWTATNRATTKALEGARPDRVICRRPQGYYVFGGGSSGFYCQWMAHLNGGTYPRHARYFEVLRELARLAGVDASLLDREMTEEERVRHEERARRRGALESALELAQEVLWSPRGEAARTYLRDERGFTDEELHEMGFGLYPDVAEVKARMGTALEAAEEAPLLWAKMTGYIIIPWNDAHGSPLTFYGRWPMKTPPRMADLPAWRRDRDEERAAWERAPETERGAWEEPRVPKTNALPGQGTKGSPLYLDRALRAGHRDLVVAVEGVLDAALLQARGDRRAVAYVGAQFSTEQVRTLARQKVRRVVVVPDPDGGGERGAVRSVEALEAAGIVAAVAPRLPDGLDPDEFLLREGLDGWKSHVARAVCGAVYRGETLLEGITPASSALDRRAAVERVLELHESLRGPSAGLDGTDLLRLLAERTGYPLEVLAERAADLKERRRREAVEQGTRKAVREALSALEKGDDAGDVTGRLEEDLAALRARTAAAPPAFSVSRLEEESAHAPEGRTLGWKALDALEVGLHPGELAVLAGRTGHGKTTVMVNLYAHLLENSAERGADEVLVFYSAEELELRIYHRLLALVARTKAETAWTVNEVRDFLLGKTGRAYPSPSSLDAAREVLRSWEDRVLIVHRPAWTVADIEADARRVKDAGRPVGAVLVDYLQRVYPPKDFGKGRRRDEEVSAVARRLKVLAEELKAPVVAGAQINRRAAEDAPKPPPGGYSDSKVRDALRSRRPQLHHLREGGSEQEADLVLGLMSYAADFREDAVAETVPLVTRLEVGTLKNRYGAPGRWAALAFEGRYGWVRDPHPREEL